MLESSSPSLLVPSLALLIPFLCPPLFDEHLQVDCQFLRIFLDLDDMMLSSVYAVQAKMQTNSHTTDLGKPLNYFTIA